MTEDKTPVRGTLVLLRHGKTQYNEDGRITGHTDVPLLPYGRMQAQSAGGLIAHIRFDAAYSSPLQRAFHTAGLALRAAGQQDLKVEKRRALIESDAGDWTGKSQHEPPLSDWKWIYAHAMPNGESNKDVVARTEKFFKEEVLPRLERGENVLLAAHSGVLRAFEIVLGIEPVPADDAPPAKRKRIPNAAPLICQYEDGRLVSHEFVENEPGPGFSRKPKNPSP